jgi:hypothetical protein
MKKLPILLFLFIASSFYGECSWAYEVTLNGQASVWTALTKKWKAGVRYIPELMISHPLAEGKDLDAEISLNSYTWAALDSAEDFGNNAHLKLYRSWLRYSTAQFEMRLGLQRINFGPAKILRTLMWFDRLDIRDPLELTDGVYSALMRYYFLNNANIWGWGLYGNDGLKGSEVFETDKDKLEFGGRFQYPLPQGEIAFSFNRRFLDREDWNRKSSVLMQNGLENRYALDGNWDIGIGLWFETSIGEIRIGGGEKLWQNLLTVGSDYTFEGGIHLLFEHLFQSTNSKIHQFDERNDISALSLDWRLGTMDEINGIGYYDWHEKKAYYYFGWLRTYDNWQLNLCGFSTREDSGPFSGQGGQFMLIYNH